MTLELKEGTSKGNTKEFSNVGRQAPPPPPATTLLTVQSERRQIAIQMMASMITASNGQTLQYLAKRSVQATDEILKALEDESNN